MGALLFTGCESEAPEVDFNVTADKTEAAVGEPVTFSISHNDMLLTVYNGEQGHNYDRLYSCREDRTGPAGQQLPAC